MFFYERSPKNEAQIYATKFCCEIWHHLPTPSCQHFIELLSCEVATKCQKKPDFRSTCKHKVTEILPGIFFQMTDQWLTQVLQAASLTFGETQASKAVSNFFTSKGVHVCSPWSQFRVSLVASSMFYCVTSWSLVMSWSLQYLTNLTVVI